MRAWGSEPAYETRPFLKDPAREREIRSAQRSTVESECRYRPDADVLSLPRALRTLAWRVVLADPPVFKKLGGTVAVSSVGMFAPAGGWVSRLDPPR